VRSLDLKSAIDAGGWDHRYAVALAVQTAGDIAAALIDTNGDGADIDLDFYVRGADGSWRGTSSGSAGDEGAEWTDRVVATWGNAEPGQVLTVDYLGEQHRVIANAAGWWLFIAPTSDPDAMPRRVDQPA
jgi:hypothetical protein